MSVYSQIRFYPVLQPFAFLYKIGVTIRNLFFDWRLLPSIQYPIPVICVGNLAVGGTGKTPMVEYLIRLLSDKYRIAVLSRGYKRKSSGYVLADENSTSLDIGDEACQIKRKYPRVTVAVDKNRRRGMRNLLAMLSDVRPQVVLLDDGFQHRYIRPSFSIVITDYSRLFFEDKLLPAGRLREPAKSVSRADLVVMSKCPESIPQERHFDMLQKITRWIPLQHLLFTSISYLSPEEIFPKECEPCKEISMNPARHAVLDTASPMNSTRHAVLDTASPEHNEILLITGIVNPTPLIEEIKKYSDKVSVMTFADHHAFTRKDIQKMQSELSKMQSDNSLIICTEKDAARMRANPYFPDEWKSRMYYIPIESRFIDGIQQKQFDEKILQHISSMLTNQ